MTSAIASALRSGHLRYRKQIRAWAWTLGRAWRKPAWTSEVLGMAVRVMGAISRQGTAPVPGGPVRGNRYRPGLSPGWLNRKKAVISTREVVPIAACRLMQAIQKKGKPVPR